MSSSSLNIASVIVANKSEWALRFPIQLHYRARTVTTTALINCGATRNFIDPSLVKCLLLPSCTIPPLQAFNIDGTTNKQGWITATTTVHCQATDFEDDLTLMIVGLGWAQIVLGMPWLMKHNPHIDWEWKTISFNEEKIQQTTLSTELAIVAPKEDVILPPQYSTYANVFAEQTFNTLPPWQDFDHAIDLKELFVPKVAKLYPLNPEELAACKVFIDKNMRIGCIWPLKSPQASPFFFVKQKDGKLHLVQDYQYLNEHTIKNTYPLSLISDLVDNLHQFSLFTKFDVWWGYNNIQIKEGDEWKAAFIMPLGLFEPTVMFFRLCGSPPTFQAFMNFNFANYIRNGWLVVYMDDLAIGAHSTDDLDYKVQLILQWFQDLGLTLKLSKCKFSKNKFKFLGVMVWGHGLVFSIIHLPPLTDNLPLTFTVLIIFLADTFWYIVW